jgi:aryl-alcohol dehydrogenase-like predicted oxidoreductase
VLKLVLGTVQFGVPYGINNQSGIPKDDELASIFSFANQSGINILDTAQGYGNSEERIANLSNDEFSVISKFKQLDAPFPFHKELEESLNKLKKNSLYGYMAHDGDLLIENPTWWEGLQLAKEQGLVKKIGYSLYSVNQLESLLAKQMIPDIIQFPYNILDRRFESFLFELNSLGVEIHTRSVYLQGLFQMGSSQVPNYLEPLKTYLNTIKEIAKRNQFTIGQISLGFVINNPLINKVVIGIDNLSQLKENVSICQIDSLSEEIMNELLSIEVKEKNLLNPVNWK